MSTPRHARLGPLDRMLDSRLIAALTSPHHVDAYLELVDPLWSLRECRARVVEVRPAARDVVTVVLAPNSLFPGHRAGQWVTLTATVGGVRRSRCFSVASAPSADGRIELTLRVRPDGAVSHWVGSLAKPGDIVVVGEPQGEFVLPEPAPERVLLVSGGTGITPCTSILRDVITRSLAVEVTFLHFARSYEDIPFLDELRDIAARHTNVKLALSVTRQPPLEGDLEGHLDDAMLASVAPSAASGHVYVCGPSGLVDAMQTRFGSLASEGRFHVEHFTAPVRALDAGAAHAIDADAPRRLAFRKSGVLAPGDGRRSLLVQAEAAGLSPEHGCRMGICHSCRCGKSAGVVRDMVSGELLDETVTEIRLCVSTPVTDVTLDL